MISSVLIVKQTSTSLLYAIGRPEYWYISTSPVLPRHKSKPLWRQRVLVLSHRLSLCECCLRIRTCKARKYTGFFEMNEDNIGKEANYFGFSLCELLQSLSTYQFVFFPFFAVCQNTMTDAPSGQKYGRRPPHTLLWREKFPR